MFDTIVSAQTGAWCIFIMEHKTFEEVFAFDNIRKAAKDSTKGVKWKPSVQGFIVDNLQWTADLYRQLHNGTYKSRGFYKFWITERGKKRFIQSVHISERTVQKCLCNNSIKPEIEPTLIYDNGASLQGKGQDFALKRCRKQLASHYRRHGKTGGVLTLDIHDYFNSIDHERVQTIIAKEVLDEDVYKLAKYFIDCFDGDKGLGLGSELSQISAVAYLNKLDHFIKEQLHIKGYARYMDDMYLIHEDIEYLKHCKEVIEKALNLIGLELNPKSKISRLDKESFIFLKHRFSLSDTGKVINRPVRANATKRRRLLKKQKALYDQGKVDLESVRQSYASWRGYAMKWQNRATVAKMDTLYFELFGTNNKKAERKYFKHPFKKGDQKHGRNT